MDSGQIKKLKLGDKEVWNMMIDGFSKKIYNIALNFASNRDDAADLTQDIFLKVYKNIDKFDDEGYFEPWLVRLAKNQCIDYWRRNKANRARVELDENVQARAIHESQVTPEESSIQAHDAEFLREKLSILPPELRLLLIMRDIQGYSYEDISGHFHIPLGTTKSRINRARARLAKLVLNEGN